MLHRIQRNLIDCIYNILSHKWRQSQGLILRMIYSICHYIDIDYLDMMSNYLVFLDMIHKMHRMKSIYYL